MAHVGEIVSQSMVFLTPTSKLVLYREGCETFFASDEPDHHGLPRFVQPETGSQESLPALPATPFGFDPIEAKRIVAPWLLISKMMVISITSHSSLMLRLIACKRASVASLGDFSISDPNSTICEHNDELST